MEHFHGTSIEGMYVSTYLPFLCDNLDILSLNVKKILHLFIPPKTLKGHQKMVLDILLNKDRTLLYSASVDMKVRYIYTSAVSVHTYYI